MSTNGFSGGETRLDGRKSDARCKLNAAAFEVYAGVIPNEDCGQFIDNIPCKASRLKKVPVKVGAYAIGSADDAFGMRAGGGICFGRAS